MSFNLFNSVRITKPKRHAFDLSHDVKMSMNMGDLVPIFCEPVLPGDTFKLSTEVLMRFAPLVSPVMHQMNVYTHFFFVPYRLIFDGWKDFITGGEYRPSKKDRNDAPGYPRMVLSDQDAAIFNKFRIGELADYLGFPTYPTNVEVRQHYGTTASTDPTEIDLLPFKAYQLIWNEYYRDQNLSDPFDILPEQSGLITSQKLDSNLFVMRRRAWEKDYFTSALPWPQAGEDVRLPLYGSASLASDAFGPVEIDGLDRRIEGTFIGPGKNIPSRPDASRDEVSIATKSNIGEIVNDNVSLYGRANIGGAAVDMSKVSAATINELRRAIKAQEFLEKSARGGSRYIEQLLTFFGVKSSDARLQRPEYLGGGKSPVVISDVEQTSQTTEGSDQEPGSPQGNLAGQAASLQRSHSFKRYFEEHGLIIGIMSVLPRTAYMQGLPRKFTKFDREDFYWPQFAHLGEQEIKNSEIYLNNQDGLDDLTFGYTPRYAEYKHIQSRVCGEMRTNLAFWHMARIFKDRPNLNENFITFKGDNRIFADTNEDYQKLWVNVHHRVTALRPMPVYGTPMF